MQMAVDTLTCFIERWDLHPHFMSHRWKLCASSDWWNYTSDIQLISGPRHENTCSFYFSPSTTLTLGTLLPYFEKTQLTKGPCEENPGTADNLD